MLKRKGAEGGDGSVPMAVPAARQGGRGRLRITMVLGHCVPGAANHMDVPALQSPADVIRCLYWEATTDWPCYAGSWGGGLDRRYAAV